MPDPQEPRSYHRPFSVIVQTVRPVPFERTLPAEPQMTVNFIFSRQMAKEMIVYLETQLLKEHLDIITVEITGPTP